MRHRDRGAAPGWAGGEEAWPSVGAPPDTGGVRPAPPATTLPSDCAPAGLYSGWGPTLAQAQTPGRPAPALRPWADRWSSTSCVSIMRCGRCRTTGLLVGFEEANHVRPPPSGHPGWVPASGCAS